ncbi:MAG: DUF4153 domain-containing protein [Pseudohongiellaceae bacterium]
MIRPTQPNTAPAPHGQALHSPARSGNQPLTRLPQATLALGLLFGLVVDQLWFGHDPTPLLLTLLTALFCGSGLALAWQAGSVQRHWQVLWSGVALLSQALLLLRSSTDVLHPLLLLCSLAALALFVLQRGNVSLDQVQPSQCLQLPRIVLGTLLSGSLTLLRAAAGPTPRRGLPVLAILAGLALALGALAVFTLLFTLADAGFERWLDQLFSEVPDVSGHLLLVLVATWAASGLLSLAWCSPELGSRAVLMQLHPWTVGVLLATLSPLFLIFAGFQLANLLDTPADTAARAGLSLAEFARRGFFQLLASAGLTLGLLTLLSTSASQVWYRRFACVLLGCVGIMLAAATQRIAFYVQSFGLSVDRVVASVFIAWVALSMVAFVATVLRQRPGAFIACLTGSGLVLCLLLAAANPAAVVVESNAARSGSGQLPLDTDYLLSLGEDAVPALVAVLPSLDPTTQCLLVQALQERWSTPPVSSTDWRDWTLSVMRARASLRDTDTYLRRCP